MFLGFGQLFKQLPSKINRAWWQLERTHQEEMYHFHGKLNIVKHFMPLKKKFPVPRYSNIDDPKKCLIMQTDASLKGRSAVILQEGHTIYFASKSLQPHKIALFAIKLELPALAMEKICHFLFGKRFQLETVQKTLENVLTKSLIQATPRLQCLMMRISQCEMHKRIKQPMIAWPSWDY